MTCFGSAVLCVCVYRVYVQSTSVQPANWHDSGVAEQQYQRSTSFPRHSPLEWSRRDWTFWWPRFAAGMLSACISLTAL